MAVVLPVPAYPFTTRISDSSPVTSGVTVQWCEGDMCYVPQAVNQDGVAYIELEDGEYYIHLNNVPAGYTYDPNAYTTDANNKNDFYGSKRIRP